MEVDLGAECNRQCWVLGSAGWMSHLHTSSPYISTAGLSHSTHKAVVSLWFYSAVPLPSRKVLEVSSYWEVQKEMSRLVGSYEVLPTAVGVYQDS